MAPRRSSSGATNNSPRRTKKKCRRRRPGAGTGSSTKPVSSKSKVCVFCEKTWPTYWHLEMHMNTHTRERPYKCVYCDANFSFLSAQLVHQNNVHLGKRYSCNLCTKTFTVPSNLVAHRRKEHHSLSKRAIFNGIQKVTKNIGIFRGKRSTMRNGGDGKKDLGMTKDSKIMPQVVKKAVPTTSQLSNLVKSLQKVTQPKRKISGEEQVPENAVPVKHRKLDNGEKSSGGNGQVPEEMKEEISEGNEEAVVEVKEDAIKVKMANEGTAKEEHEEKVENITEPLVTSSTSSQQNDSLVTADIVKQEDDNQSQPPKQKASISRRANKNGGARQIKTKQLGEPKSSTSSFPAMVNMYPFVAGLPPQQPPDIPCWYNKPPEPPPNLMFYFNGHTVPVLSLDLLRGLARSSGKVTLPQSSPSPPPSSQSSSASSSDSDYKPRASTSSRKRSTTTSTSSKLGRRKKSEPEPEPSSSKSKPQSTKMQDKKTVKRTTAPIVTTAPKKGRRAGPNSAAYRKRNYRNKCDQCGAAYKFPSQLAAHMWMHTGDKPYSCKFCGGRFSRKGNLITHLTNLHSQENLAAVKVEDIKTEGSES